MGAPLRRTWNSCTTSLADAHASSTCSSAPVAAVVADESVGARRAARTPALHTRADSVTTGAPPTVASAMAATQNVYALSGTAERSV